MGIPKKIYYPSVDKLWRAGAAIGGRRKTKFIFKALAKSIKIYLEVMEKIIMTVWHLWQECEIGEGRVERHLETIEVLIKDFKEPQDAEIAESVLFENLRSLVALGRAICFGHDINCWCWAMIFLYSQRWFEILKKVGDVRESCRIVITSFRLVQLEFNSSWSCR